MLLADGRNVDLSQFDDGPYTLGSVSGMPFGKNAQGRVVWPISTQAEVDEWNEFYAMWLMVKR